MSKRRKGECVTLLLLTCSSLRTFSFASFASQERHHRHHQKNKHCPHANSVIVVRCLTTVRDLIEAREPFTLINECTACYMNNDRMRYLHGVVRNLVQSLHVLVVRSVPQRRVTQEQSAEHVRVPAREHLRELMDRGEKYRKKRPR